MPIGTVPAAWVSAMTSTWVSVALKMIAKEVPESMLLKAETLEPKIPTSVPLLVLPAVAVTETTGAQCQGTFNTIQQQFASLSYL